MMNTLTVELGEKSYPIYIGEGLLNKPELLAQHIKGKKVLIVSNTTVAPLYLEQVKQLLNDFEVNVCILSDGEQYKVLSEIEKIWTQLLEQHHNRDTTLIALGGGVIGDSTGFGAACYLRGVNFIQIPTTLLSQVDSSVGGKTGVNHPLGKNMIGAFYQPQCVVIDIETLKTLESREFSAGMAEVIKYGLLGDIEFLTFLEGNIEKIMAYDSQLLIEVIHRCCQNKADIVARDELEKGQRALLNLGHTFGHAIENSLGYGVYLHGEAVAIGMIMAVDLSVCLGYLQADDLLRVKQLVKKSNLPIQITDKIDKTDFLSAMRLDKKAKDDIIQFILLKQLGQAVIVSKYPKDVLISIINQYLP